MYFDFLDLLGLTEVPDFIEPLIYMVVSVLAVSLIQTLIGSLLYFVGYKR